MGYWICRDCAGVYHVPLDTSNFSRIGSGRIHLVSKMGICPMCGNDRQLLKAEPLKESETTKEGAEWVSQVQSSTHAANPTGI